MSIIYFNKIITNCWYKKQFLRFKTRRESKGDLKLKFEVVDIFFIIK